jgi:hypothetical protein
MKKFRRQKTLDDASCMNFLNILSVVKTYQTLGTQSRGHDEIVQVIAGIACIAGCDAQVEP